ncbi:MULTISPECIES: isonitrile hydratase [unclassified Pseudomonas]|uniref:isonitrile hydratase n=1 Tax=unclassified Pseudomonas TaxID=196821 RepID=UPI00119C4F11|nr:MULTISPECIES: isonitrile hydratase [unclassified Pseudomonas]TWC12061.1 cyclohexyl-isocyanide hydratase [Pseudomonas sp. SJZ075]TWC18682.1 cyclohexyl-isocyanide hydratase [Pseudomonas sp. SJZ074]TWC28630.1 cyclohexyl-isocyanide hydratase [Pseudomonas sp. SJZ078]TWC36465.1 cyclohexyl-isocyanide hydratase [Pseudomonas sp. SJZ085]TWC48810.1 cyclohexyl-isocyanide hydratase [Pseudomonas sp. SJZ124]
MTLQIGLLLFPQVQQLDLTGPYDVLASLPDVTVHLIWKDLAPITSSTGLVLLPTTTFEDCPKLDVICIPGGTGVGPLMEDEQTLAFIKRKASQAQYITSVCTGALVLGAAGLLRGKRATTHWAYHSLLSTLGATPIKDRVVRDGKLITGGGITAGIDFALTLAAELFDQDTAELVQLQLEYAPAPPFDAGCPDTAPAKILEDAKRRAAESFRVRSQITERAAARLEMPA